MLQTVVRPDDGCRKLMTAADKIPLGPIRSGKMSFRFAAVQEVSLPSTSECGSGMHASPHAPISPPGAATCGCQERQQLKAECSVTPGQDQTSPARHGPISTTLGRERDLAGPLTYLVSEPAGRDATQSRRHR